MSAKLVGVREIASLLGVTRQRADQIVRTKGFPDTIADLASGRIWERGAVVRWAKASGRSVPWATVELELEQIPKGPSVSATMIYRNAWTITRLQALGRDPKDIPATREYAHHVALAEARKVDACFDINMPAEVDDEV
jgi:hypothetical protein